MLGEEKKVELSIDKVWVRKNSSNDSIIQAGEAK
jgi:hypothetical protein